MDLSGYNGLNKGSIMTLPPHKGMKLKPCPFCRCNEIKISNDGYGGNFWWYIMCPEKCGMFQFGHFASRVAAIKAWNRRISK